MMDRAKDLEKLKALPHNGQCTVAWSEEGGGEVHKIWDVFLLFEIPQYGGEGTFIGSFTEREVDRLLDAAYSWN